MAKRQPYEQLRASAKRARTIMEREQERGKTDGSVQQTRRMALSVAAAQRHEGALQRYLRSRGYVHREARPQLLLLQGGVR